MLSVTSRKVNFYFTFIQRTSGARVSKIPDKENEKPNKTRFPKQPDIFNIEFKWKIKVHKKSRDTEFSKNVKFCWVLLQTKGYIKMWNSWFLKGNVWQAGTAMYFFVEIALPRKRQVFVISKMLNPSIGYSPASHSFPVLLYCTFRIESVKAAHWVSVFQYILIYIF